MPSHYHRMMDDADKSAKSKPKSKGKLKEIHITPAKNGFTVSHRMDNEQKKEAMAYQEPEQSVFQSNDDVLNHVGKLLGKHQPQEGDE